MLDLKGYMWTVANKLIKDQDFSLLNIREQSNIGPELPVLHLFKNVRRNYIYIRLVPANYGWPNHLNQDLEETKKYIANLQKRMFGLKIKFLNLYIYQNTPSNEIEELIKRESYYSEKNLEVFTGYVDLETEQVGSPENTYTELNITKEPFIYYFSNTETNNVEQLIAEMSRIEVNRQDEVKKTFNYGKPYFTYALIVINSILFILMTFAGGSQNSEVLLDFGAKDSFLISQGEYWRLVTPIFLHIGFLHFLLNNLALYYLGTATEKIFGSIRFISIYLLAGIIGNISSFIFLPDSISAGASGSIFGLFGALLYFGLVYPDLFFRTMGKDVISILAINLAFGLFLESVDMYAHLGGLVGGFLASAIVLLPAQKRKTILLRVTAILLVVAIFVLGWLAINYKNFDGSIYIYFEGNDAIQNGDIDKAYQIYDHLVEMYPNEAYFHHQYADIVFQKDDLDTAREHYERVIELEPDNHIAYYQIALIYYFNKDYNNSISYLEQALVVKPDFEEASYLLDKIKDLK